MSKVNRADLYHLNVDVADMIEYIHYVHDVIDEKPKNEEEFLKLAEDAVAYVLSQNITMIARGLLSDMQNPLFNTVEFRVSLAKNDTQVNPIDRTGMVVNPKKIDIFKNVKSAISKLKKGSK